MDGLLHRPTSQISAAVRLGGLGLNSYGVDRLTLVQQLAPPLLWSRRRRSYVADAAGVDARRGSVMTLPVSLYA